MAPKMSSSRELAIASRKRPSSPALSESDSLSDFSESPSDFEILNNPSKKPIKKKARTTKAPTPSSKDEVVPKLPKQYHSEEGHSLFSVKWYKEVTKREAFWADFKKKVPKGVWTKRFKIEVSIDLNEEGGKNGRPSEKTIATVSKTRQTTSARKTVRRSAEASPTIDPATDPDTTEDAPTAYNENADDEKEQAQSKDSIVLSDEIKLDEVETRSLKESTSTKQIMPKENDDLISRALADPNITTEQRANYTAIKEHQEQAARMIEMGIEEENRLEKAREKRAAAKERKAAKEANVGVEVAEEQTPDTDEGGEKEKPRKLFDPTNF